MKYLSLILCLFLGSVAHAEWLTIEYGDLVPRNETIRTGQKLGDVLGPPARIRGIEGAVAPYLEPFTRLLPDAVDMIQPPPAKPFRNLADAYGPTDPQPAWAALLRTGRAAILFDGEKVARVFAPGSSAETAWRKNYSVLRHPLRALLPDSGPLTIEVYAFEHNFGGAQIRLLSEPLVMKMNSFPTPRGKTPIGLDELAAFFTRGSALGGATIGENGLSLIPTNLQAGTIAGRPASIADLAVAYRAMFHAGENAAFISLDPHSNPTLAKVNFGGLLENTGIGWTVLEADKRFKTISSGLDPNTDLDIRQAIRTSHPDFLASSERDLIDGNDWGDKWIGTRFWFYPESVEIETDPGFSQASITKARFTADAERQRGDFDDAREFERFKKASLSPSIRTCIEDLNRNYDRYTGLFPELRELDEVARLMGICSWLKRRPSREIDLDELLSVEIQPIATPASRTQMIAASWITEPGDGPPAAEFVRTGMISTYLSPYLDHPIGELFPTAEELTRTLPQAKFDPHSEIRTAIKSPEDLQCLAQFLARKNSPAIDAFPGLRERVQQMGGTVRLMTSNVISIGGGIDLSPDDFKIRVKPGRVRAAAPAPPAARTPRREAVPAPVPARVRAAVRRSTPTAVTPAPNGSWTENNSRRRRSYDAATKTLTITEGETPITATRTGTRIVFRTPK